MKSYFVIAIFILMIGSTALANQSKSIFTPAHLSQKYSQQKSSDGAVEIIDEIIKVLGLKTNFEVKAANIPNAAAVNYQGKRYILYNPEFINALNQATGNTWASVSVLAHEIGHHLNGHTLDNSGSQPEQELEADAFSGFVLRRMGATLDQAQLAMRIAAGYKPSLTHPGKEDRLFAIAEGWQTADNQITGRNDVAVNRRSTRPAEEETAMTRSSVAEQYIIGDVKFRGDDNSQYFVTTKYNLVKLENNKLYLVGKVSALNYPGFPYMIYDENSNLLLVDRNGNIVTKNGANVGYMKARRT